MAYIVTKTPHDQNVPTSEVEAFVLEMLGEDGVDVEGIALAGDFHFVKAYVDGDFDVFIFKIDGDELSECDDMLSDLEPIAIANGVADDFATLV